MAIKCYNELIMKTSVLGKKHHWFKIIFLLIILAATAGVAWYLLTPSDVINPNKATTDTVTDTTKSKNGLIHMVAMGDMMAHDTIIANAKTSGGYDFTKYFRNIRPAYQDADIVFCDQEGLSSGEQYTISGYPSFNAPTKYAADLQSGAGCNMINLANNHMGDKGVSATNATIDTWNALKPKFIAGANKSAAAQNIVSIATINGIRVSFVAFADFSNNADTPGYSINNYHDTALVQRLMASARAASDVVIVSMHWGIEDSTVLSSEQRETADMISNLGADVIIGTGPHVLQAVHTVDRDDGGRTVIWYSLGNMLSSQLLTKELIGGIAGFDIKKAEDGKITVENLTFIPTYMHYEWTAAQAAAEDLLSRKNPMIYLLSAAAEPLSRSLLNTTVAEQKQYVIDTLGSDVRVE